jgi:hypothetical protein
MEVQLPSSIIARAVFLPVELNWHWAGTEKGLRTGQNAPVSKILTLARGMDDGERAALAVKGAGASGEFLFHPPPERPTVPNTGFLGQ